MTKQRFSGSIRFQIGQCIRYPLGGDGFRTALKQIHVFYRLQKVGAVYEIPDGRDEK